jgi:L-aminopeptidase/D-esterase-like protein
VVIAGAHGERAPRAVDFVEALTPEELPPELDTRQHTTLVCVMTSAALDKGQCGRVARGASAGIARAIQPVFTDVDGDTVFCLASGQGEAPSMFEVMQLQTLAASVTAAAIRDAATSVSGV